MPDVTFPDIDLYPVLVESFNLFKYGIKLFWQLLRHIYVLPYTDMATFLVGTFIVLAVINVLFVPIFVGFDDEEE